MRRGADRAGRSREGGPGSRATLEGIDVDGLRKAALVRSLSTAGTALGISVTVLAYLVAALDRGAGAPPQCHRADAAGRAAPYPSRFTVGADDVLPGSGLAIALVAGTVAGQDTTGYGGLVTTLDWAASG